MKVLIFSFYYQPDLCAGSFRCTALVEQLSPLVTEIEVITTMPNRYASFGVDAPPVERNGNVTVRRIPLPAHKSGMFDQMKAFITYCRAALGLVSGKQYDIVFSTSSRLFTAFLGAIVASRSKTPLYLDIRDIFVDTLNNVLSPKISWLAGPVSSIVEHFTFSRAERINLVSKGFSAYFKKRYTTIEYRWFTNGIDDEFLRVVPDTIQRQGSNTEITILYAGNIGEGQGLHTIVPFLAKKLDTNVKFRIIGDGGRKQQLIDELENCNVKNVTLLPPVNRELLIAEYMNADVLFLHLNDYPAFKKVLPSKIFEYAASGKPILAGVSGYSADFLTMEVNNCAVFYPSDTQQAVEAFAGLKLTTTPRTTFTEKYARRAIMKAMALDIVEFGSSNVGEVPIAYSPCDERRRVSYPKK
ncbi:glycosyltransferase family 4 protein [Endozoicomonas sp. ALD040]|uniref:glycosyltransferase family 4 protein n=1 Tax=Endozoicomonas sp. ALD040 TaxID=3403079 RepID=UPI003BB0D372